MNWKGVLWGTHPFQCFNFWQLPVGPGSLLKGLVKWRIAKNTIMIFNIFVIICIMYSLDWKLNYRHHIPWQLNIASASPSLLLQSLLHDISSKSLVALKKRPYCGMDNPPENKRLVHLEHHLFQKEHHLPNLPFFRVPYVDSLGVFLKLVK